MATFNLQGSVMRPPAIMGFVGRSGAGKTTLIIDAISELQRRGFSVSAIKRAHDGFDLDTPGKDSWRMREAGCREVMVVGDQRWALLREYRDHPEPAPVELASRLQGVDLVIVEGFRQAPIPLIEVFRPELDLPMLWPSCPTVVAVATDGSPECPHPLLPLGTPSVVCDFVLAHLGITAPEAGGHRPRE